MALRPQPDFARLTGSPWTNIRYHARGGEGKMKKNNPKENKLRTTFTPLYTDATKKCRAWYAMDANARALNVEMKLLYNRDTESTVGMSARQAASMLGVSTRFAFKMLRQNEHYGFTVEMVTGYLGPNGKGVATQWRLTDEPYQGQPATLDFLRWNGTLFEEKLVSKKTTPRTTRGYRPVSPRDTPRIPQGYRTSGKRTKISKSEKPDPVSPGDTFLRSSQSSTASEPVAAPVADTSPAPDTSPGRNAEPATKLEQDLIEMLTVLRTFLRQATSTAWREHMQIHGKWSKSTFDRRLRIVKSRGWIRIVGDADADLERASWGSLFEATAIAPGSSAKPGADWCQESGDVGKAAMEQLERLKRGTPTAA
jgi:hypothetical protein